MNVFNYTKKLIKEATNKYSKVEYAEFMRILSDWALAEAENAEYEPDVEEFDES